MARFDVRLFGKLEVQRDGQLLANLNTRKEQELFCYLLLHRDHPQPREILASLLWGDSSTAQSKKYLRQALWQLQAALNSQEEPACSRILLVEPDWIRTNPTAGLWLDVAEFEQAFACVQGVSGRALDALRFQTLRGAVELYRGDLLEGWFQDWCLYERERLQNMYLAILDKLMDRCEACGDYEAGLTYGLRVLSYDQARERTHQRLMRMYYFAGDRTAALRQYDQCVEALRRELAVRPATRTVALYEQIRAEQLARSTQPPAAGVVTLVPTVPAWPEVVNHLRQLWAVLARVQDQLEQDILVVEMAMKDPG